MFQGRTRTLSLLSFWILGCAAAASAADEVQLVDASSRVTAFRGPPIQTLTADILVKNVGASKQVGIRYRNHKGAWVDAQASFQYAAGDGRERWQLSVSPCNPFVETDCTQTDPDFAVWVRSGGQTWWDNNGGSNYHLNRQSGYFLAHGLKVFTLSPGMVQRGSSPGPSLFLSGRVLLENIAPAKVVKLVYTVDGWRNRFEEPLYFLDPTGMYPPERFTNPGEFGGEAWYFGFNPPEGQVLEYFIQYTAAGQTFYDSNFGRNYRLAIPEFPVLTARGTPTDWQPQYMVQNSDINAGYGYSTVLDVSGHHAKERFKFDVFGDWTVNFGENDNQGNSRSGIAERSGGDINFLDGPGLYRIRFENRTHAFRVDKEPYSGPVRRTVVFLYGQTQPGQDMFLRGGLDHEYMRRVQGRTCTDSAGYDNPCALPIRHRVRLADPDRGNDFFLDWYGREAGQGLSVEGSPLTWTTDDAGHAKTVAKDGVGYTPLNRYGAHYWMLDMELDCSRTLDGWFELKSFIRGGAGWEGDISQGGTPYPSRNHFGRCGMINVFRRGENGAEFRAF